MHFISREPFIILSGGLSYDTVGRRPCLTVMHGKSTAVLEMDYSIVDFLTLCETPYPNGKFCTFKTHSLSIDVHYIEQRICYLSSFLVLILLGGDAAFITSQILFRKLILFNTLYLFNIIF